MRFFASALPGFGPILAREVQATSGLRVVGKPTPGDRSDIVHLSGRGDAAVEELRCSEDVFAEVGAAAGTDPRALAAALIDRVPLEAALSVWARHNRPLHARMTVRVVARVRGERHFRRTALRDALAAAIAAERPRWRPADPAELEFWVHEEPGERFRCGLRLSTGAMRQRGGRDSERPGALRATAAAAMVFLAGHGEGRTLVDPCCGSGTILLEAAERRWRPLGTDIDAKAIGAAGANLHGQATLLHADARRLPLADGSAGAVVSNLPFGQQYRLEGGATAWYGALLAEAGRVTAPGAPIALLAPERAFAPALAASQGIEERARFPVNVLGQPATLWHLRATR